MINPQNYKVAQPGAAMRLWKPNQAVAQITQHSTSGIMLYAVLPTITVATQHTLMADTLKPAASGPTVPNGAPDCMRNTRRG